MSTCERRRRAARADLHRHPRRPGPLRRRQRRPQPDPLVRPGRHARSGCPASSRTACTPWRWPPAPWTPGPAAPGRVRELGCKFTKPVVVPDDDDRRRGRGRAAPSRTSPTTGVPRRARGHLRRPEGARHAEGGAGWLTLAVERLADLTTLRLGGPAARARARHHRGRAGRRRTRGRRRRHAGAAARPAAATWWSPTTGFDGTVVQRRDPRRRRRAGRRAAAPSVTVAAGESWDALVARAVDERLGRGRGAVRHPRHASAPPRSRTSAPTARRSPTPSPRCACWDRVERRAAHLRRRRLRLRLPHQPVQAGARAATSCSAVTFQLRLGDLGAPVRVRRAGPRRSASRSGDRAPLAEVREAVLALRRGKGMVLDAATTTPGAPGSFFTNPFARRRRRRCPTGAPRWPQPDGTRQDQRRLADRARRVRQGLRQRPGRACRPSTRWRSPTGAAPRTADLLALAGEVRDGVHERLRHPAGQRAGAGRLRAAGAGSLTRACRRRGEL